MARAKTKRTPRTRCSECGRLAPFYDTVHYGSPETGFRDLCNGCLNTEIAREDGLRFEHIEFHPVELADCQGMPHVFHFRTCLFGPGVALDAFELQDGLPAGYRFQTIGKPDADLFALLAELVAKMRRALAVKHLEEGEFGLQIADWRVCGVIESNCDREDPQPIAVVDGREIPWWLLGRMLMTFEGFQFKLEIRDKSEEF